MFARPAPIAIGDSFVKAGGSRKVWTVMAISAAHARLACRQLSTEWITISVTALADRKLFLPVAPTTAEAKTAGGEAARG